MDGDGDGRVLDERASYGELLRVREYRALLTADALSLVGDQLTRVAVAALVLARTDSALLTLATFAVGMLPGLVGGPVLATLADRVPRRGLMVACDLARALLVACLLLPGLPLPALLGLLFGASLLTAPFEAARAATVPDVLPDRLYPAGMALSNLLVEVGQVVGLLLAGAAVALLSPGTAIGLDVLTFLASAALVRARLADRPVPPREDGPAPGVLADTVAGLRLVAGDPLLRGLLLLAWAGAAVVGVPEGLALVEATRAGTGPVTTALLLAAVPAGAAVGSLLYARLLTPRRQQALMLPVCALGALPLLASPLSPAAGATALLWFLAGTASCFQLAANAAFVRAVPDHSRGRAFGVAQAGLLASQGLALLVAGALADLVAPRVVVAAAGVLGLLAVAAIARSWPRADRTDRTVAVPAPVPA